jgi:putative phosphoribosyl transferase
MEHLFKDRGDAGIQLALRLKEYGGRENVLVLALPRGGVVTGSEIAGSLHVPLDIIIVRKIGFPGQPEFGVGAVSETGTVVLNESIISSYGVPQNYIDLEISRQKEEIARRVEVYRKGKKIPEIEGREIILVDDGAATGGTLKAAISTLKEENPARLIVAIPVAPDVVAWEIEKTVDAFICIETPVDFTAVGSYYEDFIQVPDEEVVKLLQKANEP